MILQTKFNAVNFILRKQNLTDSSSGNEFFGLNLNELLKFDFNVEF